MFLKGSPCSQFSTVPHWARSPSSTCGRGNTIGLKNQGEKKVYKTLNKSFCTKPYLLIYLVSEHTDGALQQLGKVLQKDGATPSLYTRAVIQTQLLRHTPELLQQTFTPHVPRANGLKGVSVQPSASSQVIHVLQQQQYEEDVLRHAEKEALVYCTLANAAWSCCSCWVAQSTSVVSILRNQFGMNSTISKSLDASAAEACSFSFMSLLSPLSGESVPAWALKRTHATLPVTRGPPQQRETWATDTHSNSKSIIGNQKGVNTALCSSVLPTVWIRSFHSSSESWHWLPQLKRNSRQVSADYFIPTATTN